MPPTTFSIGRAPLTNLSRRERIAEAKRKRINIRMRMRMRIKKYSLLAITPSVVPPVNYEFNFSAKRWLLTDRGIPFGVTNFLLNAGKTFPEIYMTIMTKKRRQQTYFLRYKCYTTNEPAIPVLKTFMEAAIKNQGLIRSFRILASKWIRSKLTIKNTEDLVTGEAPTVPVRLVDWPTRSIYIFEARTIVRDIVTRLTMSHLDFFPSPKLPRNPYTNEELTEAQFYAVTQQLRAAGETHWSIEALYTAKYNIPEFERDMYSKLKRTIHNSVFANPCGDVAKRILLEYIEEEHKEHKMFYEAEIYEWAVENLAQHFSIHKWRLECSKYYKVVHFPEEKEKDNREKERIDAATKRLCALPAALIEKYDAVHEKKYVTLEERAAHRAAIEASQIEYPYIIGIIDMTAILAAYDANDSSNSDDSAGEAH